MSAKTAVTTAMASRASSVALERFTDYTVLRDDKPAYFGSDGDVAAQFVSARSAFEIDGEGDFVSIEGFSDRLMLDHQFNGKLPAINADIAAIYDQDFEILGVNAVTATVATDATGGLKVQTQGGANDSTIILPHLDAGQSGWTLSTWSTAKSLRWEAYCTTGAAIASEVLYCGLKKTNTDVVATDDDQVFFRYAAGTDTKWQCVWSIANVDTSTDSGVTVVAATNYHFVIDISSSKIARFFINGVLVCTTTALTTLNLIPYVGILSTAGATVKDWTLRREKISKLAS